tara:strand:- start:122 stop:1396 length:1275 start_codon:yes stop_codon:yes gene_type:complete
MLKIKMISKKRIILFLLGFLSLIIGFILNENAAGGGRQDFLYFFPYIEGFSENLLNGFENYIKNPAVSIQPPTYYIFAGFISGSLGGIFGFKILYLMLSLFLPYIFFIILKEKFNQNSDLIFYLSLLIFISPYFRTSAIWSLGENLSLIFFGLFVYNLIKGQKSFKIKYYLYSLIFLIICSYIRHYYSVFWFFYIFVYFNNFKFKYLPHILALSLFSSIPAIIYFSNLIFTENYLSVIKDYTNFNIFFQIIQISTIILFYLIPFILFCREKLNNFIKKKSNILLIIFFSFLLIFAFEYYKINPIIGGGVFFKLYKFTSLKIIIHISIFFSIYALLFFFKNDSKILNIQNFLLLTCLFAAFPFNSIFQKYLDPLIFFILFGLLESNKIEEIIKFKKISITVTYIYFTLFLILALFYNYSMQQKIF